MLDRLLKRIVFVNESYVIINNNRWLLIFPVLNFVLNLSLISLALIPLARMEKAAWSTGYVSSNTYFIFFGILLVLFTLTNLISLLCHAALTVCVIKHMENEPYRISYGFKSALKQAGRLYWWKIIATTFGASVRFLEYWVDTWPENKIATDMLATLKWSVAVSFVVPVTMIEHLGPLNAVKRSAQLIKNNWGVVNALRIGLGALGFFFRLLALLPLLIALIIGGKIVVVIGSIITIALFCFITALGSATITTTISALYLFASTVDVSRYYDIELLRRAFRPVRKA